MPEVQDGRTEHDPGGQFSQNQWQTEARGHVGQRLGEENQYCDEQQALQRCVHPVSVQRLARMAFTAAVVTTASEQPSSTGSGGAPNRTVITPPMNTANANPTRSVFRTFQKVSIGLPPPSTSPPHMCQPFSACAAEARTTCPPFRSHRATARGV